MSVRTEADDHRDQAVGHIKKALEHINEIVVLQCSGHEEHNETYRQKLRESHAKLVELRDALE